MGAHSSQDSGRVARLYILAIGKEIERLTRLGGEDSPAGYRAPDSVAEQKMFRA